MKSNQGTEKWERFETTLPPRLARLMRKEDARRARLSRGRHFATILREAVAEKLDRKDAAEK